MTRTWLKRKGAELRELQFRQTGPLPLWGAITLTVLLQVAAVHRRPLNIAFGTVALSLDQWAVCVAMGSAVLWFGELGKAVPRVWGQQYRAGGA